jgi:hypothetical protein
MQTIHVDLARAALAIERFRNLRLADPESWEDLIPELLSERPAGLHPEIPMMMERQSDGSIKLTSDGATDAETEWIVPARNLE